MTLTKQTMVPTILATLFSAPLVLACLFFYNTEWHPHGGLQHGELLLPLASFTSAFNTSIDPTLFRGRWTLLYHSGDRCDDRCQHLLSVLGNVRLAQDQMNQVQRVLVLSAPIYRNEAYKSQSDTDLRTVTVEHSSLPSGWVYLLDPHGNMVMRYAPGFDPRGLLKDLQRLMHQSGAE